MNSPFDAVLITDADFQNGGPFIVYANPEFCAMTDPVTLSLGVAELTPGETSASLIQRADSALYQAKRGGRNRVARARP